MSILFFKKASVKKIKNKLWNIQLPLNRSAFLWGRRKTGKTF